jgi:DNA-binding NarL/FixJ family response regulator
MKAFKQPIMHRITIAIVEPSPTLGLGLQTLLERYAPEFHTAGIYRDLASFREQAQTLRKPDIILLDTAVIGFSRYVNVRELFPGYTETLLIALTIEHILPETLASFDGMLHIYDDLEQIARRLKAIFETCTVENRRDISITEREKEILIAIAKGWSNRDIADYLHLSPNTVMTYRQRISSKLGIKGTAEFTTYAMRNNLIELK